MLLTGQAPQQWRRALPLALLLVPSLALPRTDHPQFVPSPSSPWRSWWRQKFQRQLDEQSGIRGSQSTANVTASATAVDVPPRLASEQSTAAQRKSDPSDPDNESFEEGLRAMARGLKKMIQEGSGLGFAPAPSPTRPNTRAAAPSVRLLRPPTESLYMHVPESFMYPGAWNSSIRSAGPPAKPPPGFGPGESATSLLIDSAGQEKKSKEELMEELRRVAKKFLEGLNGQAKQAMKDAIDRGLDSIKDLPKEKIIQELRMAVARLRDANRFRQLRQSAWIHGERVIREGQALMAGEGTSVGAMRIPRLVPRTLREHFAAHIVSLLHPHMPLEMKSDQLVEARSLWLPTPVVWFLFHFVVNPLLLLKITLITAKRRFIIAVFGTVVMLLPSLPIHVSILLIRFLLNLFGQG
ncbi:hypothetical protein AAMO2058_001499800 [Amorphochlora amoebiformis]|mmetsp:Transcript_18337/g.29227  ORF Transcript_18337/g.29227 Transcript_18337/m.29227 type:complete len:410 (-) Transcript_18337:218-1447(-)